MIEEDSLESEKELEIRYIELKEIWIPDGYCRMLLKDAGDIYHIGNFDDYIVIYRTDEYCYVMLDETVVVWENK